MTQTDRDRLVTLRKAQKKLITRREAAEELFQVHGIRGEDPTEPPWTRPYPNNVNYLFPTTPGPVAANHVVVNDFAFDPSYQLNGPRGVDWSPYWRYRWASDLFDYLCVWSPADDYQPNIPMQREWVEGEYYDQGDLVSVYDPRSPWS